MTGWFAQAPRGLGTSIDVFICTDPLNSSAVTSLPPLAGISRMRFSLSFVTYFRTGKSYAGAKDLLGHILKIQTG
jgi:hypothetical protein